MKTLQDIYTRLTVGTSASEHTLSPAGAPGVTMATLDEIYSAIPTNDKVLKGTNAGTANDTTTFASGHVIAPAAQIIDGYSAFGTDGLVINGTGSAGSPALEWSADDPTGYVDWATAGAYCTGLGGGYRLPYMWELAQYFQQNGRGTFQNDFYWSSTEYPNSPDRAYYVIMGIGLTGGDNKTSPWNLARCAR